MKQIILLAVLMLAVLPGKSQTSPAENIANRIADKMKDSLSLTQVQRDSIYSMNMQLHTQKIMLRKQYSNMDSLRIRTQAVEHQRDIMYKSILTPRQFGVYKQKKRMLISAN